MDPDCELLNSTYSDNDMVKVLKDDSKSTSLTQPVNDFLSVRYMSNCQLMTVLREMSIFCVTFFELKFIVRLKIW